MVFQFRPHCYLSIGITTIFPLQLSAVQFLSQSCELRSIIASIMLTILCARPKFRKLQSNLPKRVFIYSAQTQHYRRDETQVLVVTAYRLTTWTTDRRTDWGSSRYMYVAASCRPFAVHRSVRGLFHCHPGAHDAPHPEQDLDPTFNIYPAPRWSRASSTRG